MQDFKICNIHRNFHRIFEQHFDDLNPIFKDSNFDFDSCERDLPQLYGIPTVKYQIRARKPTNLIIFILFLEEQNI